MLGKHPKNILHTWSIDFKKSCDICNSNGMALASTSLQTEIKKKIRELLAQPTTLQRIIKLSMNSNDIKRSLQLWKYLFLLFIDTQTMTETVNFPKTVNSPTKARNTSCNFVARIHSKWVSPIMSLQFTLQSWKFKGQKPSSTQPKSFVWQCCSYWH